MPDYRITNHAEVRMSQRAVRDEDIALALTCGTQIGPAAWLIKDSDANREIAELKRRIQRIERLKNKNLKIIVEEDDKVATCYSSSRSDQRRTFRNGRTA